MMKLSLAYIYLKQHLSYSGKSNNGFYENFADVKTFDTVFCHFPPEEK